MDTETNNINNISEKNVQIKDMNIIASDDTENENVNINENDTVNGNVNINENENENGNGNGYENDDVNKSKKENKNNIEKEFNRIINEYIKFTFYPDIENVYLKYTILIVEIIHVMISSLGPLGLLLPSRLLIYHAIALICVMISWYIFDGCIITILKTKLCRNTPTVPLVPLSITVVKYIQTFFIALTLFFYFNPKISPFKYVYRLMTYLSTNFD